MNRTNSHTILCSIPNASSHFRVSDASTLTENSRFGFADPPGSRLGSGGGTLWLLWQSFLRQNRFERLVDFASELRNLVIHAGGQSRRLPAYATQGKAEIPVPVFRWIRGQHLDQRLIDLQLPLLQTLVGSSSHCLLVASGDVLISYDGSLPNLPDADVVCVGVSVEPSTARRHGVFLCPRTDSSALHSMLQKPSAQALNQLSPQYDLFVDTGIWLFTPRAVAELARQCGWNEACQQFPNGRPNFYDLYADFGAALGTNPTKPHPTISQLTSAVVYLPRAEFLHFGSTNELMSSTERLINKVTDQRVIHSRSVKPHPALFTQNAVVEVELTTTNGPIWIENAHVSAGWQLCNNHVITGVPVNQWQVRVPPGACVDVVANGETQYALRPYSVNDRFSGDPSAETTRWLDGSLTNWCSSRGIEFKDLVGHTTNAQQESDIHDLGLFPLFDAHDGSVGLLLQWMLDPYFLDAARAGEQCQRYLSAQRVSAAYLLNNAAVSRIEQQRRSFHQQNLPVLAKNYQSSVFYQTDLTHVAKQWQLAGLPLLEWLPEDAIVDQRISNAMLRHSLGDTSAKAVAFGILRDAVLAPIVDDPVEPICNVLSDQMVWARSPVRIDLAGGWTDTPPFCITEGGSVVNIAIELNGQPPLQVYVRQHPIHNILIRSIDQGTQMVVDCYAQLKSHSALGSEFSIPLAALCLVGFHPQFSQTECQSLKDQLRVFGGGLELTIMAAVPKGSGLGTSSILAATVLAALSDFCGLGWSDRQLVTRTLALEQMLQAGGGWQDQCGGVYPGVKSIQSQPGVNQQLAVHWLSDRLFRSPESRQSVLLYYTGVTRTAHDILGEIVEGMFLNHGPRLAILREMKQLAKSTEAALSSGSYHDLAGCVRRSWQLNNQLDPGTTNPEVEKIIDQVDSLCAGYKLAGAGGGGYLLLLANSSADAVEIRRRLTAEPPNDRARFVECTLSDSGLVVSRS